MKTLKLITCIFLLGGMSCNPIDDTVYYHFIIVNKQIKGLYSVYFANDRPSAMSEIAPNHFVIIFSSDHKAVIPEKGFMRKWSRLSIRSPDGEIITCYDSRQPEATNQLYIWDLKRDDDKALFFVGTRQERLDISPKYGSP